MAPGTKQAVSTTSVHQHPQLSTVQSLYNTPPLLGQIKKISVFLVTGLIFLDRVAHIFFSFFFFLGKKIILCILKGISPFKMHKIIFFPEKLKKSRFHP